MSGSAPCTRQPPRRNTQRENPRSNVWVPARGTCGGTSGTTPSSACRDEGGTVIATTSAVACSCRQGYATRIVRMAGGGLAGYSRGCTSKITDDVEPVTRSKSRRTIALAAGGTGGHLFPAEALARELIARGHEVVLYTERRGAAYTQALHGLPHVVLPARSLAGGIAGKFAAARDDRARDAAGAARHASPRCRPAGRVRWLSELRAGHRREESASAAAAARTGDALEHGQQAVVALRRWRGDFVRDRRRTRILRRGARLRNRQSGAPPDPGGAQPSMQLRGHPQLDRHMRRSNCWSSAAARARACSARSYRRRCWRCRTVCADASPVAAIQGRRCRRDRRSPARRGIDTTIAPFFDDMGARLRAAHLVVTRAGATTAADLLDRRAVRRSSCRSRTAARASSSATMPTRSRRPASAGACRSRTSRRPRSGRTTDGSVRHARNSLIDAAAMARTLARPDAATRLADVVERMLPT